MHLQKRSKTYRFLNYAIAVVWLINGLCCKILNLVPRHQEIVARILGNGHAVLLTKAIGVAEMMMVGWIISGYRSRFCSITQILVVAIMNSIEFKMVPDILLFGKINAFVAFLFISVIFFNEFFLHPRKSTQA